MEKTALFVSTLMIGSLMVRLTYLKWHMPKKQLIGGSITHMGQLTFTILKCRPAKHGKCYITSFWIILWSLRKCNLCFFTCSSVLDQPLHHVEARSWTGSLPPHPFPVVLGLCQQHFAARYIHAIRADRWVGLRSAILYHLRINSYTTNHQPFLVLEMCCFSVVAGLVKRKSMFLNVKVRINEVCLLGLTQVLWICYVVPRELWKSY